jgi:PAS domain S-box-containing protein
MSLIGISYSTGLVVLSVVVALMGAFAAIEIAQRIRTERHRRNLWTFGGTLAMGLGVWSMHFVGMLALQPAVPVWYDALLTYASGGAAVFGCAIAFVIFNRVNVSAWLLSLASVVIGVAIAGMHYTGMEAMRMGGTIGYDPILVSASVAIAILLSFAGLALARTLLKPVVGPRFFRKAGATLLLGSAVIGMHYTAMAAAHLTTGPAGWRPTGYVILGTYELGLVIGIASVVLLGIALAIARFAGWTMATRSRFENLLELAPQVVWFGQPDGHISYSNPYWYEYTGLSERESLGYGWTSAIHPEDRDEVLSTLQTAAQKGNNSEVEFRLRRKDGDYCWFLARGRPGRDEFGKVDAWLGIAVDIEERKKAEQEAWAASQAKSEFLASMSHELRTPLNAIGGYAELLALGVRGALNAEQAQDIARIRRSQQHLLTLITDVLNFAKVDAGQTEYRLTAVPVDESLRDTESMIAPQILARGLHYSYKGGDKSYSVLADPEKLQQIVLNLLSNAVKFTEPGGTITLSSEAVGSCIEIRVADTGPGISEEKLERIFEAFVQVDRRLNQPVQGVGLGLAISQDLAKGMGGGVSVESVVGKGSTFTLTLPRAPRMDPSERPTASQLADRTLHELAEREPPVQQVTAAAPEPTEPAGATEPEYHEA